MRDFNAIKVQHTLRSCNAITHSLAKLVLDKCETVVWEGLYPSEIMYLFNHLNE